MELRVTYISSALWTLLGSPFAFADIACDKSYGLRVDVSGRTGVVICDSSSESFVDSINDFKRSNINYTKTSAVSAFGRFNDVDLALSYAARSTKLVYAFPQLGDAGSFTGTTRKESQQMFEDYIKTSGIMGQIMNYQARHSPTSPITGAGGLVPMTIASDFNANFADSPTAIAGPGGAGNSDNLIGAQLNYASFNMDNTSDRVKTTSIPFSYTLRNDIDPRRQLIFRVPVTYVEVGVARTIQAGLGVSYRIPLSDQWTLTPGAGYSFVESRDRASLASLYSASLSSAYVMPLGGFDLSIGNMLGYYATGRFSAGNYYSYDPDLKYVATRNGVMLSHPISLGKKFGVQYSLIDTRYLGGEKPYVDNFQELGVTLGTNPSALDARSFVRAGFTYIQGPGTRGLAANIGYWF